MSDDVLVARLQREMHDSIEKFMKVQYPGTVSTVDWMVIAENVVEDGDGDLLHTLHPAVSSQMSGWKLRGMSWQALKYFQTLTA